MKYPQLVPDKVCKTSVTITQTDGINENGAPNEVTIYTGKCNYSEKATKIMTPDKQLITLAGVALFNGDIDPARDVITGSAVLLGGAVRREIYRSEKARNPDGTVNYTRLELM